MTSSQDLDKFRKCNNRGFAADGMWGLRKGRDTRTMPRFFWFWFWFFLLEYSLYGGRGGAFTVTIQYQGLV
jgi:hypothetical protein